MRMVAMLAVLSATGMTFAGEGESGFVEQRSSEVWHFRVGPVLSPRVRVSVRGPRMTLPYLPKSGSVRFGTGGDVAADPSDGYVGRSYVDGYVKPDEGTEDPDSMIAGLTWDWGANDLPSQYENGQVAFRTDMTRWTETESVSSYGDIGRTGDSDRDSLLGLEAMGGWTFFDDATFDAALDGGFRYYGSRNHNLSSRYGTTVSTTRNEYRYVDRYDASGWTSVPRGSYVGTSGGPGRLLGATPTREEELMSSTTSYESYFSRNHMKLDYHIWDLRLGPTLGWEAMDVLTIRGGVYGLLGLVDASLKTRAETLNGAVMDKKSCCDAIFGMAFGISAQYDLTGNLFLTGGVEYDWWSDKTTLHAGGADARIELSDFTVSLGLGVGF